MKQSLALVTMILAAGCGEPKAPAQATATSTTSTTPPPIATTTPPPPATTEAPVVTPPPPTATAEPTTAPAALDAGVRMDGGKIVVTNAIDVSDKGGGPSNSRMPQDVIASLRPLFTRCFMDGMKKDPKLAGSVTMSAKIGQDGKVAAVTPKRLDGLNDPVVKCLSDKLKAAQFASAGSPGYASSLDIPLNFSSSP